MKVRKSIKMTGFTLVEMLVVIAIIAILAGALFPAIQNAMGQAQATAMKNKGRGIWVAINSANMEREPLNLGTIWPDDVTDKNKNNGDGENETIKESSVAYFTFLMSEGGDKKSSLAKDAEDQVVTDLSPSSLIASGITPGKDSLKGDNIAWRVCGVGDSTAAELPFLFSRNLGVDEIKGEPAKNANKLALSDIKPFNTTRAVWVTRGGGVFDARRKYLTGYQVMGDVTNVISVWKLD